MRLPQLSRSIPLTLSMPPQTNRIALLPSTCSGHEGEVFHPTQLCISMQLHLQASYRITAFLKPDKKTEVRQSTVSDDASITIDNIFTPQKHTCFPEFTYKEKKKQQSVKVIVGLVAEMTGRKLGCLTDFLKQNSCGKTTRKLSMSSRTWSQSKSWINQQPGSSTVRNAQLTQFSSGSQLSTTVTSALDTV